MNLYEKLKNILPTYEKVKSSMLMLESLDEKQEVYIAPINQMRNALDHIFIAVASSNDAEKFNDEFKAVEGHLERAAFDCLDLLAATLGLAVKTKIEPYDLENITSVFPNYFTEIRPKITELQKVITECRKDRVLCDKNLKDYLDSIKKLQNINTLIECQIPSLEEYREKREKEKLKKEKAEKKKKKNERFWQFLIGPVIGFAFAVLLWLLTK